MHCVDLGESFQTHIYLQNFASIQPRTSPTKFAASRDKPPSPGELAPTGLSVLTRGLEEVRYASQDDKQSYFDQGYPEGALRAAKQRSIGKGAVSCLSMFVLTPS